MRGYCTGQTTSAQSIYCRILNVSIRVGYTVERRKIRERVCSRSGEGLLGRPFDGELMREVQKFGNGRSHDGRPEKTIRKAGFSLFCMGVVLGNGTKV